MGLTFWRRDKLRALFEFNGAVCHYCKKPVRLRVSREARKADDATIDHKIPKSAGGTNDDENLVLACNACNSAKENRSYEDFIERPYRLTSPRKKPARPAYRPRRELVEATKAADKAIRWSMAASIARGDINEAGAYRKAPMDLHGPEPRKFSVKKMTALEVARYLRAEASKRGKSWPLA